MSTIIKSSSSMNNFIRQVQIVEHDDNHFVASAFSIHITTNEIIGRGVAVGSFDALVKKANEWTEWTEEYFF
jgi:hypothetical protein